jgi:hypothetical protein
LERFPAIYGIYGGTFDDPNWFERSPEIIRHIFLDSAQNGTLIPAGWNPMSERPWRSPIDFPFAVVTLQIRSRLSGARINGSPSIAGTHSAPVI